MTDQQIRFAANQIEQQKAAIQAEQAANAARANAIRFSELNETRRANQMRELLNARSDLAKYGMASYPVDMRDPYTVPEFYKSENAVPDFWNRYVGAITNPFSIGIKL